MKIVTAIALVSASLVDISMSAQPELPVAAVAFECADVAVPDDSEFAAIIAAQMPAERSLPGVWGDRAALHDVGGDSAPEHIVPTTCGATGNCTWVIIAEHPTRSLGVIEFARVLYVVRPDRDQRRLVAFVHDGAGRGILDSYVMQRHSYVRESTRRIDGHTYEQFFETMGLPQCWAEESAN